MKRWLLFLFVLLTVSPSWAYEELGRPEDSASSDGQSVVPMGSIRQDTIGATTSTDGDYQAVKSNSVGRIYTSATIDAALPTGANSIGTVGLNAGANSIGTVGLNAGANAIGTVGVTSQVPGTGATNLGKAHNGTFVSGDTGVSILCVRKDTSTTNLGINGTYNNCGMTSLGEIYTSANTEITTPAALADNTANPTLGALAAYMMCYNGTTWDRCQPGANDTDDNSIAFSQFIALSLAQSLISDGTSWVRYRTYLEDTAASGHDGGQLLMMGTVRQDTPAGSTSVDGDYANLKSDSVGRLWVNCGAGCASGSTTPADAFANPTTAALNMTFNMGWNGATWDRLQVDGSKYLKINCATGCAGGATTPSDAFANPTTAGLQMVFPVGWNGATWDRLQVDGSKYLKVNCATGCAGGATTPTDAFANPTTAGLQMDFMMGWNGATWDRLQVDGSKFLKTVISAALPTGSNTIGTVNMGTFPGTGTEDAAETAGGTLIMMGSVRRDTPSASTNATAENATINTDANGYLWARQADPCTALSKSFVAINQTTNTQLFTGTASNRTYVCSVHVVSATAQNVALVSGTGSVCGTGTAGLAGGTTAATGWNLAANGGLALGGGNAAVAKSAADADNVCLLQSGSGQISGTIAYVVAAN